ncbi:unnamed protein product [Clonostachys rosea f. rosea IK726]|uniref:Uncharacterized protein n=1 Tax=Clonostachys rosea f. rosea IK726 TaxID=1349383 RepID=A0ACA9TQI6_BIOOC|nr:unnamed protein product [Clonostachys rosea f. rosea IK726]
MGRPPATQVFPYGSTGIIEFEEREGDGIEINPKERGRRSSQREELCTDIWLSRPLRSPLSNSLSSKGRHEVLDVLFDRQRFFNFHHHFMIGPSFSDQFRLAILMTLHDSQEVVLGIHQILLKLLNLNENPNVSSTSFGFTEAARSLQCLQSVTIGDLNDAAAVLLLGQILFVYHLMVMGTSAYTIAQNCLLSARGWYPMLMTQPCLQPIFMAPILIDTVDSLVRRRIPIIEIPLAFCDKEDRTMGLSVTLVPILYDLCRASNYEQRLSMNKFHDNADSLNTENDNYSKIEQRIRQWEPSCPHTLFLKYSHIEVSAMMMQARVYRIAGLLLIHRLRYPLGVEDEEGLRLAMIIVAELSCFVQWAPQEVKDMAVYLPLFLAMIEVQQPADQILSHLAPQSFFGKCVDGLRGFVKLTQDARRVGFRGLWFDLVGENLSTGIIP